MSGHVAPGFEPVREAFERNWRDFDELGAAFTVLRGEETLLDLQGGWTDRKKTTEWQDDTLVAVFSTGKAITAVVMAWLVDQGLVDYDAPIADYWPEFAAHGKGRITVGDALSHQTGLPGLTEEMESSEWFDRDAIEARLAAQAPMWDLREGGSGYQPIIFGFLADAVARRTDGRTIGGLLREVIAGPRGLDFHVGTPARLHDRVAAHVLPPRAPDLGPMNAFKQAAFMKPWSTPGRKGAEMWREAEFPAANGHGTSRAIATLMGVFASGGRLQNESLVSSRVIDTAMTPRVSGPDRVLPFDLSLAAGVMANRESGFYGPEVQAVGHYGFGGSCGFADPVRGLSGSYVMNRQLPTLAGDPRAVRLIDAVYDCL
tara:strand:- start:641 stop:1759 length:1119 start_codon:yes stop_codon:yes gene_type:complete